LFSKDTVESKRELSVFSMKRLGMLTPGYTGLLTWTSCRTGEDRGSVGIKTSEYHIDLTYRSRSNGGEWEPVEDKINLTSTFPNYGGARHWFLCPSCNSRRAKLYGGKYFRCRSCRDLCNQTQLEDKSSRLTSAMYKIRHRLGDYNGLDSGLPDKPKGMHWQTYFQLIARYNRLSGDWNIAWARRLGVFDDIFEKYLD